MLRVQDNLLLGVTGHKSAVLTESIFTSLAKTFNVQLILTEDSKSFVPDIPSCAVDDAQEWYKWKEVGDPVLHIELTRWADGLMVVPMSANCLAKAANGLCDDLLTCVLRAWPPQKPLLLAPAMHHLMWQHPFNQTHIHAMLSNERCGLLLGDRIVFESPNNESEWQNFSACHVDRVAELVQDFLAMYPKSAAH